MIRLQRLNQGGSRPREARISGKGVDWRARLVEAGRTSDRERRPRRSLSSEKPRAAEHLVAVCGLNEALVGKENPMSDGMGQARTSRRAVIASGTLLAAWVLIDSQRNVAVQVGFGELQLSDTLLIEDLQS